MALEIQTINYNIDTRRQSSSSGATLRNQALPQITRRQQDQVLAINLLRTLGGAVTDLINADDTFVWVAELKDDFDQTTTVQMKTFNVNINRIGDRPDLDVVNGKLSVLLDADTLELLGTLGAGPGATGTVTLSMELQIRNLGAPLPKAVYRWDVDKKDGLIVLNIIDDAGAGPGPTPVNEFYTIPEIDAIVAGLEQLQSPAPNTGVDAKVAATETVFNIPAVTEYIARTGYVVTRTITGAAGLPTIQWKTSAGLILSPAIAMSASEAQVGHIMEFELDNEIIIPAADVVQAEITIAGTSTTHTIDYKFNGQKF